MGTATIVMVMMMILIMRTALLLCACRSQTVPNEHNEAPFVVTARCSGWMTLRKVKVEFEFHLSFALS